MPAFLDRYQPDHYRKPRGEGMCAVSTAEFDKQFARSLHIGLINNMPDAALEATERQFVSLLDAASYDMPVRLSLYSLPGVPRSETGARYVRNFYSSIDDLRNTRLDGLIVTGREPVARNLADEPYWESFTGIVDWAKDNTHSTVWSCLAAHAAVLYMDGIRRIKSSDKNFGIFECERVSDHALIKGTPQHYRLPHSRWNGLAEDALANSGYGILTRTQDANVDAFIKRQKSLFVFFQGHPEYESNTLLLEYRRDVGRYLREETNAYPRLPQRYFRQETEIALTTLQNGAMSRPGEELLAELSKVLENASIENTWRSTAACLYRNWLEYLYTQRELEGVGSNVGVEAIIQ